MLLMDEVPWSQAYCNDLRPEGNPFIDHLDNGPASDPAKFAIVKCGSYHMWHAVEPDARWACRDEAHHYNDVGSVDHDRTKQGPARDCAAELRWSASLPGQRRAASRGHRRRPEHPGPVGVDRHSPDDVAGTGRPESRSALALAVRTRRLRRPGAAAFAGNGSSHREPPQRLGPTGPCPGFCPPTADAGWCCTCTAGHS